MLDAGYWMCGFGEMGLKEISNTEPAYRQAGKEHRIMNTEERPYAAKQLNCHVKLFPHPNPTLLRAFA
jgi:hypothetical protein